MRSHKDAFFGLALGFVLTSAVMVPPILEERTARAERLALYEASGNSDSLLWVAEDRSNSKRW